MNNQPQAVAKGITTFRVKFRRFVVVVVVHSTWKTLRTRAAQYGISSPENVMGFCHSYDRLYANGRKSPEVAEVHLHYKWLSTFVLAHEFTHAGLALLRRRGCIDQINKSQGNACGEVEEYLCDAVGEFMRQAINKLYDHKLIQ